MSSAENAERVEKPTSNNKRKHEEANDEPKPKKASKRRRAALRASTRTHTTGGGKIVGATPTEKKNTEPDFVPLETAVEGAAIANEKELKTNKKKKSKKTQATSAQAIEHVADTTTTTAAAGARASEAEPEVSMDTKEPATEDTEIANEEAPAKKGRFIVFIGNLPFTATTESVTAHFASIKPASVRHLTQKGTTKSKGYAFLEFDAYDRMLTCLKLFHHSNFEDGKSPGRKINVELTAGGGGAKSVDRKDKLRVKNEKLNEQRQRRAEQEEKQKKRKELKEAKKQGGAKGQAEAGPEITVVPEPDDGIHPSRRAQMDVA